MSFNQLFPSLSVGCDGVVFWIPSKPALIAEELCIYIQITELILQILDLVPIEGQIKPFIEVSHDVSPAVFVQVTIVGGQTKRDALGNLLKEELLLLVCPGVRSGFILGIFLL